MKDTIEQQNNNKILRRFILETSKKAWINGLFLAVTWLSIPWSIRFYQRLSQKEISDMFVTLITQALQRSAFGVLFTHC